MKMTKKQQKRLDKAAIKAFKALARYKAEMKIIQKEQRKPQDEQCNHAYAQWVDGATFVYTEDAKTGDLIIDYYKGLLE